MPLPVMFAAIAPLHSGIHWWGVVEEVVWVAAAAAADSSHVDTPLNASPSNVTAACIPVRIIIMLPMS